MCGEAAVLHRGSIFSSKSYIRHLWILFLSVVNLTLRKCGVEVCLKGSAVYLKLGEKNKIGFKCASNASGMQ